MVCDVMIVIPYSFELFFLPCIDTVSWVACSSPSQIQPNLE